MNNESIRSAHRKIKKVYQSLNEIVVNDYYFALITKAIMFIMTFFNSILLNRYLGPTLKGEYSYYLNIINIVIIVLNLGIYQAYPYYKNKQKQNMKDDFFGIFSFQLIVNLIIVCFITASMSAFNLYTVLVFMLIPVMVFSRQLTFLSLVENLRLKNVIDLFGIFLYSLSLIIVVLIFHSNILLIFILLYIQELTLITLTIRKTKFKFKINDFSFTFKFFKEVAKFGFIPMITVLLSTLNYKVDIFIVKDLLDYKNVGLYSVGLYFADLIGVIPNIFQEVLFSRSAKKNLLSETTKSLKITLYLNIFIAVVFLFIGNTIITLLYGDSYSQSALIANTVIFGMIPMTFFKLISGVLIIKGDNFFPFITLFVAVISNIALNYLFIPRIGISGAAAASVISYTFSGFLILLYFCKKYSQKLSDIFFITKNDINQIILAKEKLVNAFKFK